MPRTKTGVIRRRKHKKVLGANKGMRGANKRLYKRAHEAYLHSGHYAYVGRKNRKRDMRSLWIVRINAGLKQVDETLSYAAFIHLMKQKNVQLDRKILADLAATDFPAFSQVVQQVRA